jgi:hypothetical protein
MPISGKPEIGALLAMTLDRRSVGKGAKRRAHA